MTVTNNEELVKRIARLAKQNQELEEHIKKLEKLNDKLIGIMRKLKATYEKLSPEVIKIVSAMGKRKRGRLSSIWRLSSLPIFMGFQNLLKEMDSSASDG